MAMTFSEFIKKKKQGEQVESESQETAAPASQETTVQSVVKTAQSVKGAAETKPSFSEFINKKKASSSVDSWVQSSNGLLGEIKSKYSDWNNSTEDYTSLYKKASDLISIADTWRQQYEGNTEAAKAIDEVVSALDSARQYAKGYYDFYSQWNDRDEYLTWDAKENFVKNYISDPEGAETGKYGDYDDTWMKEAKYRAELQAALGAEDFEENSSYVSTKSSNLWDKLTSQYGTGYNDVTYEYINNVDGARDEIKQARRTFKRDSSNPYDDGESSYEERGYDFLTEDEVKAYNYYYATQGKEKAQAFLDSLEDTLVLRKAGQEYSAIEGDALREHLYAAYAGVKNYATGWKNLPDAIAGGEGFVPSSQYVSSYIRSNLTGLRKVFYDLTYTTSNMLPTVLTSAVATAIGGPVAGKIASGVSMGSTVAGNSYAEMKNLGYDDNQARGYAVLSAASEVVLEQLIGGITGAGGGDGIFQTVASKILPKVDNAIARVAIDLGANMLDEGVEEAVQSVLEPIIKMAATGEDFEGVDIEEVVYSGLLGILSAGVMEGGSTVLGSSINGSYAKENYGDGSELVNEALEIDPNNTFAQKLKAKLDSGKTLSGLEITQLVEQSETTMYDQDVSAIREAAIQRLTELGETGDIDVIANALVKKAQNKRLSLSEDLALINSTYGQRVANELNTENINSGEYTSAWAEKIGTNKINAEEYGRLIADLEAEDAAVETAEAPAATIRESRTVEAPAVVSEDYTDEAKAVDVTETAPQTVSPAEGEFKAVEAKEESSLTIEDASKKYGAQAGAMVHTYVAGQDVAKYDQAYKAAYDMGKAGVVLSYVMDSNMTAYLNKSQREVAYEAGLAAGGSQTEGATNVEAAEAEKTTRISTGEEANVKEIVSVKGKDVKVRLENGEVVSTKDIHFATSEEGLLYESAADMKLTATEANAFVQGYDAGKGLSVEAYALGFREAYRQGKYGLPMREVAKSEDASKLTKEQRELAYKLGREDAQSKVSEKQAAVNKKKASIKEADGEGKVIIPREIDTSGLTERQRYSLMGLEEVAKALGIDFYIFESKMDENGKRQGANGWYDPKDGSIHIDLYAGLNGEGTIMFTAAHELTHFIRDWSPEKFKVFADFLLEQYGEKGISVDELVARQIAKAKNNNRSISYDTAYEEVVADSCETMLADGEILQKIAELKAKDKSLWQKIKDYIAGLAAKIRQAYAGLKPDSVEGKYVSEMMDATERLKALWTEALVDASAAYSATSEADGSDIGGEKFQLRDTVEESGELVAVHNITEAKLIKSLDLGGLPMPSIAIVKAQDGHDTFGDISLVFRKETIDPQFFRSNKVYSGDAWTPTYPTIEYKINEKTQEKIRKKINDLVSKDIQGALGRVQLDYDNLTDTIRKNDGDMVKAFRYDYTMKYAYLLDEGKNIELPMTEKPLTHYSNHDNGAIIKVAETVSEDDLLKALNGGPEEADTVEPAIRKAVSEYLTEKYKEKLAEKPEVLELLLPKKQLTFSDINNYANEAITYLRNGIQQIVDYNESKPLIDENIDQVKYEKWLKSLFSDIVEKEGIRNEKDLFTPSGNRRSFEALHYEHNLENVIRAMKEKGTQGVGAFGGGNIFGASATEYTSIEEIKNAKDRLKSLPEEEYDKIKKGFSDRFFELASSLPKHKDSYRAIDDAANMMIEAIRKYKTKSGIANYLRRESNGWANYYDYIVDDLIELVRDIRNMPTGYFEAKPQRAVGFDEVATAIIPDNASVELKSKLQDYRITYVEYESGNEAARLDALNSLDSVRFSDRDADYMAAVESGDTETAQKLVDDAAKAAGYTGLYYHGAKNGGGFHVFRDWSYFTGNKAYAQRYASRDKADSLYTTYVKMEKPFDTRNAEDRKLFAEIRQEYGLGEIQDSGLPDWTDGYDISDYIDENDLDYDGIILDEGGDLVDGKPVSRGLSYVVRKSVQVKSADPVTYDDLGNVIPLSERFNAEDEDIRYSDRDFASQVDAVLNGADTNNSHLKLMDTPKLLQEAGLPDLPILMTAQHLKSITSQAGKGQKNYHGLDVDVVKKLPEYISDPVMIADSLTRGDSVVIITEAIDSEKKPVIAAILLDGSGRIDGEHIKANIMTSAYGKDNFQSFLNRIADNDSVIYWNEKKSQDLSVSLGIQFPNAITSLNSGTIIHQSKAFVNREISESDIKLSDRDDLKAAKEGLKAYGIDAGDVLSVADNYLNNYSGSMSKTQFRTQFLRVTEAMAKAMTEENVEQMEGVNQDVMALASEIVNHPSITGELAENLREIKQHLRKTRIKIPQNNKGDFDSVGGFEAFRRKHIGSFILASDGINVDTLYAELQELFGVHWFPEGIDHVADQLMMIAEVSDTPLSSVSEASDDTELATNYTAGQMLEKLMEAVENGQKNLTTLSRGGYSNRSLLANALESVAQNDIERNRLREYKSKIDVMAAEQARLSEVRAEIKALSFAKGKKDVVRLGKLRDEAVRLANRITVYDSQLLRLEASTALKNVLQYEKQAAYKKAELEGKEALAAYRERALKKQKELSEKYQESRKKGAEGRKKTEMRHRIKNVVGELNQYLLSGTKERHVPIELQKAVAEALNAVNMDTVGAEKRIAKLKEELLKAKTPEKIQEISRKIDNIREMGDRMDGKLKALKDAYDKFVDSDDPMIAGSHDEVISNSISKVIQDVGDTPLRGMTMKQLESVYDMYKMVLTTVRVANKTFKSKRSESIAVLGERVMEEVKKAGVKSAYRLKGTEGISKFSWNNLKPVYAFDRIGSDTFTEIFDNVRTGEDVWATDVSEAREFYLDKSKMYKYDSWDFGERFTFRSASGKDFDLSLDQIMSLYAYSKREQAAEHLRRGGIVFDETTEVTVKSKLGIPLKFNPTQATAYNLSDATLSEIVSKLTPEQKAFVDEMQDYLSTVMGNKGNEVSLALYGVKLFKEKNYFPLKSATQFMAKAKEQQKGEVKIKNSGFSKETQPKANNPIVLTPFMDVWANHVNEMSMYHAFVLPMEDFYRVYNYKTPTSEKDAVESVDMNIQNAHGKAATQYIDQLLKDLNGGAISDPRENFGKALISKFKKASVTASLSVVIQQPTAIVRAMSMVNPKYFVGKKVDKAKHAALWAEVKKYAPVAIIKEMGYFDTNMGRSAKDFLTAKEYDGFTSKVKGFFTDSSYRDEVFAWAPAKADELGWVAVWDAVKRETLHTHKDLTPGSEAFLKAVGERFTEVITKTQVYDSVLARSGNMRSKSAFMNMMTSFMAEPTTTLNMIGSAGRKIAQGDKPGGARIICSVVGSMILNAALVSLVYAGRDDDEDETYSEKYLSALSVELLEGINPITYIPFAKDIWSIFLGYDVERSDLSLITDLSNSLKKIVTVMSKDTDGMDEEELAAHEKAVAEAWMTLPDSLASIFGIPVKNIRREINGVTSFVETAIKDANERDTTPGSLADSLQEALQGATPVWNWLPGESKSDKLYDAIVSGDAAYVERLEGQYETQSALDSAIRRALREHDPRIKEAAEARYNGDIAGYMRIAKEIIGEGNFSQDNVVAAINAEISAMSTDTDTEDSDGKVKSLYKVEDYFKSLMRNDATTAAIVKADLIETDVTNGKEREDAEDDFNSSFASYLKEQYEEGGVSDYDARNMLIKYGGKSEEDAVSKVQYWGFKQKYPDYDLSEEAVAKYYDSAEPSGIDIDVYYDYYTAKAQCTGYDYDGDGRTDSGSKKAEILSVIDSLPITAAQKDVLYELNGWSLKTIYEAPWH